MNLRRTQVLTAFDPQNARDRGNLLIQDAQTALEDRFPALETKGHARSLARPASALRRKNRQFVRHVLRLAGRAPHARARRGVKLFVHALARVTTPALDKGVLREDAAVDFLQI